MSTRTRAGRPSGQAPAAPATTAVLWGMLGAVPPTLGAVSNMLLFRVPAAVGPCGGAAGTGTGRVVLLAVALVLRPRTRRAAQWLFALTAVLTVLWPMYRGALGNALVAVAFSAVPLLLAARATAALRGRPVRLPPTGTAVVAGAVIAAVSLTTLYQGG